MKPEKPKREGVFNFVDSMLQSAQDTKEVQPQTRYDHVDPKQLERQLMDLQKGIVRKKN